MNESTPLPILLWCPECGARHIDEGEFATKSHHTHACQICGHVWRPAIVPTFGVQFLPGFKNGETDDAVKLIEELRKENKLLKDHVTESGCMYLTSTEFKTLSDVLPGKPETPGHALEFAPRHISYLQLECDRLKAENATLREQNNGHAERIAKQSELLSRRTEKQ